MQAIINGVLVMGTPEEIQQFQEIVSSNQKNNVTEIQIDGREIAKNINEYIIKEKQKKMLF